MKQRRHWKSETAHVIAMMRATGNRPGVIADWKSLVAEWAARTQGPDAEAVNAWLPQWQSRPFYTARELAPLWPALAIATGYTSRWPAVLKSAKRLEHELDFYGLPHFEMGGQKYYVVERLHFWKNASNEERQREFDHV